YCSSVWRYWLVMFQHAGRRKSIPWKRLGTSKSIFLSQRLSDLLDQVPGLDRKLAAWIESQVSFIFRQCILSAGGFEQEIAGEQVYFRQVWIQAHRDICLLPRLFQLRSATLCIFG